MNNIYKVIWSKAKNCYVVASEIARSHTKSATGSEKIGGVTRRSLLASLMALSLLCGGLGVASAENVTVHVDASSTPSTATEVYTTAGVNALLNDKADKTELVNKANATEVVKNTENIATNKGNITNLENNKADKDTVTALEGRVGGVEGKVTTLEGTVGNASGGLVKDVNDLNTAIGTKANRSDLEDAINRITTNETNITALQKKTTGLSDDGKSLTSMNNVETDALTVKGEIKNDAGVTTTLTDIKASMDKANANETAIGQLQTTTTNQQTAIDGLNAKTTQISYNAAQGTTVNEVEFKAAEVDAHGKRLTGVSTLNTTGDATIGGALTAAGVNAGTEAIKGGSLSVTGAVNGSSVNTGTLSTTGNATVGGELNATGKVSGNGLDARTGDIKGGSLSVTGAVNGSSVNTGTLNTTGDATVGGNLKVTGTITTDRMVFGDPATNNYTEIDHGKVTSKNQVNNGAGEIISSSSTFNAKENKVGFANSATGEQSFHKQTSDIIMDNVRDRDNSNNRTQTKTETKDIITDENGNSSTTSQTASQNKTYLKDKDGKNTNSTIDTAKGYDKTIKGENGETSTKQDELDITNTAQKGTITNDAQNIVNNASGNITNKANTMDTNVTGQATESYGKLDTTVNGAENHTVNGQQTNTVGGGQINNITGGQKNNILTGNQETTVSNGSIINKAENGDISNTAKNVTNVGTESVTNKVGTNEVKVSQGGVDIKVGADTSRTMTDGRIIDEAGDMTVTTDKTTGTTFENGTPKDTTVINGGTIGTNKVNANETNTKKLTAGADDGAVGGRLTVDADGVKGSYMSGKYTSKSYILANTLKSGVDNGKKPTDTDFVGSRTDHYMDGDKAKLDETVKDADGSNVTNKTSTGTVTTITDGTNTSIIDQKKDNITSAVGDGTTSTVIKQDKDNVTIASSAGTVGIAGKDIINNATDTITNTAGTKITDTAGDSSVTTENGKGTTFTNTGANTAIGEGTVTDTTIKGNTITTGKVTMDYAEVMKDLGVRGNANITGKTTTGSLEVTSTSTLKGDVTMESNATVKKDLKVEGTTTTKTLKVTENAEIGGTLKVTKKATFEDSVSIANDLSVGGDVTAKSYKVDGKTYISAAGINANDQKITNVADGSISEGSKDAVNGGQLYDVKRDMEHQVDKVGANAAAMANLRPMEFDPSSKWNIAAAIGNYGSETAAALGAFYRPNDDVMVNLSTAFGTGENMVGGGVSVRLGKGSNKLSREETNALKAQVADLTARMDALLSVLNPNMSKDFPDVPENHWAYEAVSRLAGNDIVQGYPDGEFHGERTMTRYEMAEIIYNALSRGAEAEKELVEEFKPELQAMAASEKATAERAEG